MATKRKFVVEILVETYSIAGLEMSLMLCGTAGTPIKVTEIPTSRNPDPRWMGEFYSKMEPHGA